MASCRNALVTGIINSPINTAPRLTIRAAFHNRSGRARQNKTQIPTIMTTLEATVLANCAGPLRDDTVK